MTIMKELVLYCFAFQSFPSEGRIVAWDCVILICLWVPLVTASLMLLQTQSLSAFWSGMNLFLSFPGIELVLRVGFSVFLKMSRSLLP